MLCAVLHVLFTTLRLGFGRRTPTMLSRLDLPGQLQVPACWHSGYEYCIVPPATAQEPWLLAAIIGARNPAAVLLPPGWLPTPLAGASSVSDLLRKT